MASKCISKLARSPHTSASLSSLDLGPQVHLQTCSIPASKCISEFTRCQSPSASPKCSMTASKYIFKERWWVYGYTWVTEVDRVMASIYFADPGVDRHHLISISSVHTMKIYTLSFPTVGFTRSVPDFVDPRNVVDPQCPVVSLLHTRFLPSSKQQRYFS